MSAAAAGRIFRVALAQLAGGPVRQRNVDAAVRAIAEAKAGGASLVSLPECFNSPYGTKFFDEYAETIPGPTTEALGSAAEEHKIYVVGGSIPERDGDKLYNTCVVFDPTGTMVAKHRKVHLFDIDVPGGITFQESETLSPGDNLTIVETPFAMIGIGICYDMRFAEMAQVYAARGCQLLCYPGAFNMTTGPAHWELLQRARALDNQLYVMTVSPARDTEADYIAWGHSSVVDPWGTVIATCDEKPNLVFADLDMSKVDSVRQSIPIRSQKRNDLYKVTDVTGGNH